MTEQTRRKPSQGRSLATIAAIFEAASQILEGEGVEAFNTNRVAERAGVSIGTLYQYFKDKDDILIGMAQREAANVRDIIAGHLAAPPGAGVRPIVHALVRAFEGRRATRMAFFDALARRKGGNPGLQFNRTFMDQIGKQIGDRLALPKEAVFVLTRAIVSILRTSVFEDVQLSPDQLEEELVCLMESYLAALRARAAG